MFILALARSQSEEFPKIQALHVAEPRESLNISLIVQAGSFP